MEIVENQRAKYKEAGKIFHLITDTNTIRHIQFLVKDAGINKHVTWHTERHTFATPALTMILICILFRSYWDTAKSKLLRSMPS